MNNNYEVEKNFKSRIFAALIIIGLISLGVFFITENLNNERLNSNLNDLNSDDSPSTCLFCSNDEFNSQYETISNEIAYNLIQNKDDYPNLIILDVRTQSEFYEGHIEDAILIPLSQLETRLSELETYKNTEIIVYCRSGNRSATASQILIENGFNKILNIDGGFLDWKNEGYPTI